MTHKILIVDDEAANLRLLERLFRRDYQTVTATSGSEALELLQMHDVALIISDQRMPGMTGIEFLKRAFELRPHTVRIILTGYTDVNSLVEAINSGVVYKYVTKPWVNEDLQQTVARAIEHSATIKGQYKLTLQNERLTEQLNQLKQSFVRLIGDTLYLNDAALHEHLQRVSGYAVAVGLRLNLDEAEREQLLLAAFLHEIGRIEAADDDGADAEKISASDAAALQIRNCRAAGALQMLGNVPGMNDIVAAVRHHAERFDGTGSPENLAGEQIPLFSRIVAVAKAYDEMTEPRDEKEIFAHERAIERLRADAETKFDPNVVEAFCAIDSIEIIGRAICAGVDKLNFRAAPTTCDAENMPLGAVLQKFKTEPLLALRALAAGNAAGGAATARLLPLMSKIGEAELRSILGEYGASSDDEFVKTRTARSLRCAVAAQLLAAHTGVVDEDDAYTLGLLCDVGEILLFNLFPFETARINGDADVSARSRRLVETFGIDAAHISRRMLERCGVPADLTAAIENQPDFMRLNRPLALLVRVARKIADTDPIRKTDEMNTIENGALQALNLSRADLNKICDRAAFISDERGERREQVYQTAY